MGLEEVEIPKPGRGQVRVRVRAAATNPADWGIRAGHLRLVSGSRFPRGLGHDFAGVVDAIGSGGDPAQGRRRGIRHRGHSRSRCIRRISRHRGEKCLPQAAIPLVRVGRSVTHGQRDGLVCGGRQGEAASWPIGLHAKTHRRVPLILPIIERD